MFIDIDDVLGRTRTKGDVATVLIAGTAGYLVDAGLNSVGFLEPGIVGIVSASGMLGLKQGVEALAENRRARAIMDEGNPPQVRAGEEDRRVDEMIDECLSDLSYNSMIDKEAIISQLRRAADIDEQRHLIEVIRRSINILRHLSGDHRLEKDSASSLPEVGKQLLKDLQLWSDYIIELSTLEDTVSVAVDSIRDRNRDDA
jgi:hypothetical protein